MNVVILGATKGMGRALARLCAERGDRVFLLGRDATDLTRSAADLVVRGGQGAVVVTAGLFGTQEELEADPARTERLLHVNFVATVMFCEAARKLLLSQGGGTLCVFGSVAGDRARKPVVLYGASKAGLAAYLNGLDHRYYSSGLRVICVRPGFVKTGMTAGLRPPPFAGEPDQVAKDVRAALLCPRPVVYTPLVWELVMTAISVLPRAVMRRIKF